MTQRTINRSLIIHNDFAMGIGTVAQERGTNTSIEQKVELTWIFRTLDEIRSLDHSKYTRVSLHTPGPLAEYYFDITSAASDDADEVLAPIPAVSLGRWLKVGPAAPSYTTADLNDITNISNTSQAKQAGYMVWNSTINRPVWSVGAGNSAIWVDAAGTTLHTPV